MKQEAQQDGPGVTPGAAQAAIPLSIPSIAGREWEYVKESLDTGWVSSAGPFVDRFEREFAAYVGSPHAIACVNGTAALALALQVAGVKPGDEVLAPTLTFIAPINAVSYINAVPLFMDCDDYYNLDVDAVARFLKEETEFRDGKTYNRRSGRRVGALVVVHIFGNAANVPAMVSMCRDRGIAVVEDACEAVGTRYNSGELNGRHAGTIGDIGCFSFNGNKIITTGGGGMVVTSNPHFAERVRYFSTQAKDDEVRYVHGEIGYNYRLTNLQAALGVAQLEQLPGFLETKRRNFARYAEAIQSIPGLQLAAPPAIANNNLWMYALRIDSSVYGEDREALMRRLSAAGIQSRPVWHLNHLQKPYRNAQAYRIERAIPLLANTLNLPCSTGLTSADVDRVVAALRR